MAKQKELLQHFESTAIKNLTPGKLDILAFVTQYFKDDISLAHHLQFLLNALNILQNLDGPDNEITAEATDSTLTNLLKAQHDRHKTPEDVAADIALTNFTAVIFLPKVLAGEEMNPAQVTREVTKLAKDITINFIEGMIRLAKLIEYESKQASN